MARANRVLVAAVVWVAACGQPGDVEVPDVTDPDFGGGVEALVPAPTCDEADVCLGGAQVRPQCAAAAAETTFGFEAVQTFNVPRTGSYDFVRIAGRRFGGTNGLLRIEIREPTGGLDTLPTAPVVAVARIATSLLSTTTGSVPVRFAAPANLVASTGAPRYAMWFLVDGGPTTVGLGCSDQVGIYPEGSAAWRKSVFRNGQWTTGAWRAIPRDLFFGVGATNLPLGACSTVVGATCEDGNQSGGDGCDPSCRPDPGFSCSGIPSTCVNGTNGPYGGSTGATATATSVYNFSQYGPERLLDGVKTYAGNGYMAGWIAADSAAYPIHVTIDLGQLRRINRIVVTQTDSDAYTTKDFDLEFSINNANWVPFGSNTLPHVPRASVQNTRADVDTRYIRLTVNSGYRIAGYDSAGLAEIELFGP